MPRTFVWHPGRGPKRTERLPEPTAGGGKLRIEQIRSGIGHSHVMNRTLRAIGLRHHQAVVIKDDTPSLRGQLNRVRHLVKVTPVEE